MTLDQLRIFLAVAERGHVTRAAKTLNLTQSAVSSAITTLEAQHDVKLFDRIGRGIEITDAGRTFVEAAKGVVAQAQIARLVLEDLALTPRGRLHIHASQTVSSYWLPRYLVAFHERYPSVDLALTVGNTTQVAQAVTDGTADLGFVEGETAQDHLLRRVVARDELVLLMAHDHVRARQRRLDADDYRGFTWILREPGSGTRAAAEAHFNTMGLAAGDLDVALELPSNEAILAAVAAGRCVSILSSRAVGEAAGSKGLRMRRIAWSPRPERAFAVLTHSERHRTKAVTAMLELIEETRPDRETPR